MSTSFSRALGFGESKNSARLCARAPHSGWVVDDEERARISWGLLADPGDRYAGALIAKDGPVEALRRVKRSSVRELQAYFSHEDVDEPATAAHLQFWKKQLSGVDPTRSLRLQQELGIHTLSPDSASWPSRLSDLGPYQPHTLWCQGDLSTFERVTTWLGVVGSRQATPQGILATQALVGQASADGRGIISGGALGIDAAAHHTAHTLSIPQIAVMAGGLDRPYPIANQGLLQRISTSGLLVSEAPCTTPNDGHRFLHRNRLIAALSDAVVVVEAAWRSGAVNTARHASALGRGLGVVPGRWDDEQSAGCFRLVRDAAAIVLSEPSDVHVLFPTTSVVTIIRGP